MMSWIEENQAVLGICISIATLLVWVIYAQLLFSGFRRQRSPGVIINRGKQKDMNALCIIGNMSMEAIYVEYIVAILETSHGTVTMDVTDYERAYTVDQEGDDGKKHSIAMTPVGVHENTRQGPLLSGDFMHIGTFNAIVWRLAREAGIPMWGYAPEGPINLNSLTVQVIALYGPDTRPISASRRFNISSDEEVGTLTPASWKTHQEVSFLHRRRIRKKVQEMNETNFSVSSTIPQQED